MAAAHVTLTSSQSSTIRKVREDAKLRPLLQQNFAVDAFVKEVIESGRSEECFESISAYIDSVNEVYFLMK